MRCRYIRYNDFICYISGHKRYEDLSCSKIGLPLLKNTKLKVNQRNSWHEVEQGTTILAVVKTMEEQQICNARISFTMP